MTNFTCTLLPSSDKAPATRFGISSSPSTCQVLRILAPSHLCQKISWNHLTLSFPGAPDKQDLHTLVRSLILLVLNFISPHFLPNDNLEILVINKINHLVTTSMKLPPFFKKFKKYIKYKRTKYLEMTDIDD